MRKEFLVERQGRSFVLYAGLLDLAHSQGLKSITTELIQIPSEANNRVAIATAVVVMETEARACVFTGIGDAAPNNVAPAMQTCLIRMSETRAKARALRDAVNIATAAFEELDDEDAQDGAPESGYERVKSKPLGKEAARAKVNEIANKVAEKVGTRSVGQSPSTRSNGRPIQAGPGPCPKCHAPEGKAHGDVCGKENH